MKRILKAWSECDLIKCFEIPVIDKRTGDNDHVIFDIEIHGKQFFASHISLNSAEEKSEMIAYCRTDIDPDFSLDENLAELYDECQTAILESEWFELNEN